MKKLSIKMLFLTLGSFSLLITGIVVSLYVYFNHFYEPQKINGMIQDINTFSNTYKAGSWSDEELYQEVSKFMKKNNATMSIVSLSTFDNGSEAVSFKLGESFSIAQPASPSVSIINDDVTTSTANLTTVGVTVNSDDYTIVDQQGDTTVYDMSTSTLIDGSLIVYPVGATLAFTDTIVQYEKDDVKYMLSDMPFTNFKQVDFIKEITLQNGEVKNTIVNVSLQSVDEVNRTLNRFIPFLILLAILLSVIMTFVYSRTISRPIVAITSVANRMANMELGITCDINRKDELGELSTSLNTLSSNLKTAHDELVVKNEQLKEDYENEIRQEASRKEFVANVSHELKTPLGVIKSYAEGIQDGVKAEKRDYYVHVILDEIDKMDHLIQEMLEISRFVAGAVTYHKTPVQLGLLIDRILMYFHDSIQTKDLQVIRDFMSTEVLIDEEKIGRVLSNLIGNAVKYCPEGSRVIIKVHDVEEGVKVSIENECAPLSEEVLSKIWDRFYKGDVSHNREIEGSGLGLAIAKTILEGHGSSYGVENIEGGVRFYFVVEVQH